MKKTILLALLGAGAVLACNPPGESGGEEAPGGAAGGGGDTGTPAAPPGGGGGSSSGSGPSSPPSDVALTSASASASGRAGDAVRIVVKGTDSSARTTSAIVKTLDAAGKPVEALDTDWDGLPDAAERRFRFDGSTLGKTKFTGAITIPGVLATSPTIAKVEVTLVDDAGTRAKPSTIDVAAQPVRGEGEACDPAKFADRCQAGMSCGGTPASCRPGVAPELTQAAYVGGARPRMIFRGTEPDEDVKSIAVEFLDGAGNPQSVNLSGDDENPEFSSGVVLDATRSARDAEFVVQSTPVVGFDAKVPKIGVTVSDHYGHTSARTVVSVAPAAVRAIGQACDWAGFDACTSGSVCAPGTPTGTNTCTSTATVRAGKCADGPLLDPAKGATRAFGRASGASLWDAPVGCVPSEAVERPEAAVRLHLAAPAKKLVLTTALPETTFDTVLYLVPGCPASASAALGCNDDTQGFSSTITLTNVPAGDYTVIVDSISREGGRFGVSVTTE